VREQVADTAIDPARQIFKTQDDFFTQPGDFLWQNDAEFANQSAQSVVGGRALFDESLPGAVQAEDGLLVFFLDRDKSHLGPGDSFADGRGIRRVVLAAAARHAVGRDKLGGHQFNLVAVLPKLSGPVVRSAARFHADQAGREIGNQRQQLVSRHLRFVQRCLAIFIYAMYGEYVLGKIDSDYHPTGIYFGHNAHGLPLSLV